MKQLVVGLYADAERYWLVTSNPGNPKVNEFEITGEQFITLVDAHRDAVQKVSYTLHATRRFFGKSLLDFLGPYV